MHFKVDAALFSKKLRAYQLATAKSAAEVLNEQARLLAKRLMDLTMPKTAAQGKKRVQYDLNKVYQRGSWFTEQFEFKNKKLGDRVKEAVQKKDELTLDSLFKRSARLRKLFIEHFTPQRHKQARNKRGGVSTKEPFSFPLRSESEAKRYVRAEQKAVGTAKGGWAACLQQLGGTVPGWLSNGHGKVTNRANDPQRPYIELRNQVRFVAALMQRTNAISRALAGRAKDMEQSFKKKLAAARRAAGFAGR